MNDILFNIISIVVTVIVLPLLSIAGTQLIRFINSKIKNNDDAKLLTMATTIVINTTRCIFQTYVDTLKSKGEFNAEAQKIALNKAREIATSQMTSELKKYIVSNFGDLDVWLTTQIESSINQIKQNHNLF